MTTLQLLQALSTKANETKKQLQRSFFSGDKKYFNEMLLTYKNADVNGDVNETIRNISSMHARSLTY